MTWARSFVVLLLPAVVACGGAGDHAGLVSTAGAGSNHRAGSSAEGAVGGAADTNAGGAAAAGSGASLGTGDDDPVELGGASGNEVQVVLVPPGEDQLLSVTPQIFLEATEDFYVFDRAGVVGERRFALDSSSLALIGFAADGTARSDAVLDLPLAAAARGEELIALQLDERDELVAVTYDDQLQRAAGELRLTSSSAGAYAIAGSVTQSVAVWNEESELHGQLFDAEGVTGEGFDFGPQSCGVQVCAARVVHSGARFVVLWSRVAVGGESMLSWGTIDDEGAPLSARNVLSSVTPIELDDAVALGDGRLAVLLTLGSPARNPLLLFVDGYGTLEGPVHVYSGASAAWTMATDGSSLLIAARSDRSQGVIRQLDLTGEPLSGWLVIDDSGIASAFEPRVALFSDRTSYGAVARMTDGSSVTLALEPRTFPEP